jgi:hypothetical protein
MMQERAARWEDVVDEDGKTFVLLSRFTLL